MKALLSLVLVLSVPVLPAVEDAERERLHQEISGALNELAETQKRMGEIAERTQVVVPPALPAKIATRRTLAADWLRRVGTPGSDFPVEEADGFRDGLQQLNGRMATVAEWMELKSSSAERWPQSISSKEVERYRVFLSSTIAQALQDLIADAESLGEDAFWQRQRRHELILDLASSEGELPQRWAKVPPGEAVLREYRDHRAAVRAKAEAGIQGQALADDQALERDQAILWSLEELVQLVQDREDRLAGRDQPPAPQPLALITACQAAETEVVRALIAHQRAAKYEDPAWHRQEQELRRAREHRRTLSGIAWEWLELEDGMRDASRRIQEEIAQLPTDAQPAMVKRLGEIGDTATAARTALEQAIRDGKRIDALRAKAVLRLANHDHEALRQDLEFQRERLDQDNDLQARVGDGAAPAARQQLAALAKALSDARARQQEAGRAAIATYLASELAQVATDEANVANDLAQQEVERAREQFDQRREQVIDALENPAPKPEGDPKF